MCVCVWGGGGRLPPAPCPCPYPSYNSCALSNCCRRPGERKKEKKKKKEIGLTFLNGESGEGVSAHGVDQGGDGGGRGDRGEVPLLGLGLHGVLEGVLSVFPADLGENLPHGGLRVKHEPHLATLPLKVEVNFNREDRG